MSTSGAADDTRQPDDTESIEIVGTGSPAPRLSVLIPVLDERPSLETLIPKIAETLDAEDLGTWEILVVDDGSTDGTAEFVTESGQRDPRIRLLSLRRNFGKSMALQAGFENVDGEIIILMDGDGQDDPAEISRLLAPLDEGYDLATGRRAVRNDRFIKRNTSKVYNRTTNWITGVEGRDFNSGFKAMRTEITEHVHMYGELHRYIPVLAHWSGFRVCEVDVEHHERTAGTTKFGRARFWRGFFDLITVKFLTTYTARPFHLFGGLGAFSGLIGGALLLWMLAIRISGGAIGQRPALMAGILLVVVAVQLSSLGLLAELVISERGKERVTTRVVAPRRRR